MNRWRSALRSTTCTRHQQSKVLNRVGRQARQNSRRCETAACFTRLLCERDLATGFGHPRVSTSTFGAQATGCPPRASLASSTSLPFQRVQQRGLRRQQPARPGRDGTGATGNGARQGADGCLPPPALEYTWRKRDSTDSGRAASASRWSCSNSAVHSNTARSASLSSFGFAACDDNRWSLLGARKLGPGHRQVAPGGRGGATSRAGVCAEQQ